MKMNPGLPMPFSVLWMNETWALLPWAWAILIYQISADWIKVQLNEVLFELSHSARVLLRAVTKSTSSPPPAMPLQKTGCYFVQNILALESSDLIVREKKLQLSTLFQKIWQTPGSSLDYINFTKSTTDTLWMSPMNFLACLDKRHFGGTMGMGS